MDNYILEHGAQIGVIGGGPTGSLFSIFALKMAQMVGKDISITIFEPKDFTKDGPSGCNRCGGIISELLVQTLAVEGINLPPSVVQRGIDSYRLHTEAGDVFIETPAQEKTIATVYRGGGPKGIIGKEKESFDNFLLKKAIHEGARHLPIKVDRVSFNSSGRPEIYSKDKKILEADLVVGCFGVNSPTAKIIEDTAFGYKVPKTVKALIAEIALDKKSISEYFGSSIHLFLLPTKNIKFAALIPKGTYVTLCILGKGIEKSVAEYLLSHPVMKKVFPGDLSKHIKCLCLPKMNISAPKCAFTDRMVVCGDAGSTRLFKDGLGAAYLMGKAVAKTVIFEGVSEEHFRQNYYPVYKNIIVDNLYGSFLYTIIGIYRRIGILTRAMLEVVRKEQNRSDKEKILSSILWDMFTGNERYKNIFFKSLKLRMHIDMWEALIKTLLRRGGHERE